MISIFNRKELFADISQEAAANVWSTLDANNIEYEMITKQNISTFRKNMHYAQAISEGNGGGLSPSWFVEQPKYIYKIYVKKSDYARAKELCALR